MLIVNGQVVNQGADLGSGVTLEEIKPKRRCCCSAARVTALRIDVALRRLRWLEHDQ